MAGEPGCLPRFGFDEARVMDDCQALYKITKVLPHSPAQKSGLRVGDIIEAIDSVPVETWNNEDLVEIYEKPTSVPIKVSRNGETLRRSIRAEVMCTQ